MEYKTKFLSVDSTCLLPLKEAARQIGIQPKTLYSWVHTRKIQFVKAGRLVRFDQRDINAWIENQKVSPIEY